MKKELEQHLKDKFPQLYSAIDDFQCGDGWFDIINSLSIVILDHCANLPLELQNQIRAVQVKEKFGYLRYYTNHSTPFVDGAIALAECASTVSCEQCGQSAKLRMVTGLLFCACEKHFEEKKKERE
jgi:hypothetical protein